MNNLYARAVFFVADAERSLHFYTEQLGFSVDWKDSPEPPTYVFQVSLFGFELILNQVHDGIRERAGHGRRFIGLEDDQIEPVRKHIAAKASQPSVLIGGNQRLSSGTWTRTSFSSGTGRTSRRPPSERATLRS
ncbi:MAG: VOC family protein [Gemmatimonadaceae bacterium]